MAITIAPNLSKITGLVTIFPIAPTFDGNGNAVFQANAFNSADGAVTLNGANTDNRNGWEVGWIQAEWIETNWGSYRGQHKHDGAMFLQRARPPARTQQGCRDTLNAVNTYFTKSNSAVEHKVLPTTGNFPLTVTVKAQDKPGDQYLLVEQNERTNKPNYLDEVQLEFMFCTVLTVRDPAKRFHHQAHFYWNLRWQYRFDPKQYPPGVSAATWTVTPVAEGIGGAMGPVYQGAPNDHRFTNVLTTAQVKSCNDVADGAFKAVEKAGNGCRHVYTDRDHQTDVRR
jgi:hypothetical protein